MCDLGLGDAVGFSSSIKSCAPGPSLGQVPGSPPHTHQYGPMRPSDTCWLPMMFSSWAPNLRVDVLPEAPEATCLHPSTPTLPQPQSWGWYHFASREVACCLGKGYTWGGCTLPHPEASSCPCTNPSLVTCDSSCLGQGHRKPVWGLFLPCDSGQGCPSLSAFSAEECPLPTLLHFA